MNKKIVIDGQKHLLTTEHSASSYGHPVLVHPDGTVWGPGDGRFGVENPTNIVASILDEEGFDWWPIYK